MPVLITFLIQVVLLALFDPQPRLGIADLGRSEITTGLEQADGIELTRARSAAELRQLVVDHDVDGGLVLPGGFDASVRAGERPLLELYLSGESRVTHRIVLAVTAIDRVREVEGSPAPVQVELSSVGHGPALPVEDLAVLSVLMFALLVTGTFVPGLLLVQEREHRTLDALLVTPTTIAEILLAKAAIGFTMALVLCTVTLALNGALSAEPLALLATLAVAAILCNEIGLLYGTTAKDAKGLYNMVKTLNVFILGPLIFYFFPNWPQWIAKLFPTYWFIDPLYRIAVQGMALADVWWELAIALGIGAALVGPIVLLGRRMEAKLAAGG
jgi:ABC-2 type transport system permease protein